MGLGGLFSWPLGYVIIMVSGRIGKGLKEDQVALVTPDSTTFGLRFPVILGTPTINWIMNVIKENKIDELSVSLNGSRISHLLAECWAELCFKNDRTASQTSGLTDLNEAVKTMKQEEIEAFLSKIVHGHTKTVLLGNNMYLMTQAPEKGEEPCLPHLLSMVNTYTKMTTGSRHVAIVIKNQTAALIFIGKGIKWVVAANRVPPIEVMPATLEKLDKMQGVLQIKTSI